MKRSLDFWRVEDGVIRENRVLVELLDVFARMRACNRARVPGAVPLADWRCP